MECSNCNKEMEEGYLAWYEPLAISRIIWQKEKPGFVRLKGPKDSIKVIKPPKFGKGDPKGYICKDCKLVSFYFNQLFVIKRKK